MTRKFMKTFLATTALATMVFAAAIAGNINSDKFAERATPRVLAAEAFRLDVFSVSFNETSPLCHQFEAKLTDRADSGTDLWVITSLDGRIDFMDKFAAEQHQLGEVTMAKIDTVIGVENGLRGLALADGGKQGDLFGMATLNGTIPDKTTNGSSTAGYDVETGNRLQGVLNL